MSFKKVSLQELEKINSQASNIKDLLRNKVLDTKLGEYTREIELEKQYRPLASVFGLRTQEFGDPTNQNELLDRDGKKIIRMSELLNSVLNNINVGNERLQAANPDYVDPATTPGIKPILNVSELVANTLNRIAEVRDNISVVDTSLQNNTTAITDQLAELNTIIAEGKIDVDNVANKLGPIFYARKANDIEGADIDDLIRDFYLISDDITTGLRLSDTEKFIITNKMREVINDKKGQNIKYDANTMVKDVLDKLRVDDNKTLKLLFNIDKEITKLGKQNRILNDNLKDLPTGLATLSTIPTELASINATLAYQGPEDLTGLNLNLVEDLDIEPTTLSTIEPTIKPTIEPTILPNILPNYDPAITTSYKKTPNGYNNTVDLIKSDFTFGNSGIRLSEIGNSGYYLDFDKLASNSIVTVYDEGGNVIIQDQKISDGYKKLIMLSRDEYDTAVVDTLTIGNDEINLLKDIYKKAKIAKNNAKGNFLKGESKQIKNTKSKAAIAITDDIDQADFTRLSKSKSAKTPQKTPQPEKPEKKPGPQPGAKIPKKGDGAPKLLENGMFGNLWINRDKLGAGLLIAHKLKVRGGGISRITQKYDLPFNIVDKPLIKHEVDSDFIDLITKRFNSKKAYAPNSVNLFKQISEIAGINPLTIKGNGKKKNMIKKGGCPVTDEMSGKIVKIITDPNDLIERMALLTGTIESGNLNPVLRGELSEISDILLNKGMIDKNAHKRIYKKYIMIEY